METTIKCLPKEVQGKLRSGVALPSLQQCVEELIVNSIDAGATCVGVRLDMDAFKVQVIDNGAGMSAEDIGCVGNRYYTSKCNSLEDLEDLRFYGFRGEALASIVSLATLVEISSRSKASVKTHVKIFREGMGLNVFEPQTTRPSAGTTVTVCNYFHNMPVRRKRMDAVLENERIRQRLEAISLMHPSVSFTLKNDRTGAMVVQLPKARNTYYRFVQIHSLARAQKLGEIYYTSEKFEVTGYIGREGHYNNSLQFLYVNKRLMLRTRIHKLLNALLRRLSGSNQKDASPDGHITTRSPKPKRTQDLHGVYIVNIKCHYSEYDICLEPAKTLIEFTDWDGILHCIEQTVKDFLKRENLVAEFSLDDMDSESLQTDTDIGNQGSANPVTTSSFSKVDSCLEMVLASDSVYRSNKEISINMESNQLVRKDDVADQLSGKITKKTSYLEDSKQEFISTSRERDSEEKDIGSFKTELDKSDIEGTSEEGCKFQRILSQCIQREPPTETATCQSESGQTSDRCLSSTDGLVKEIEPNSVSLQSFVNTHKVSLSDPFIHKGLQIQEHCKSNEFQHKEISLAPKRKISLGSSGKTSWEGPATVKVRKVVSLRSDNFSQSLDQFRRIYGKFEPKFEDISKQPDFESLGDNMLDGEKTKLGLNTITKKETGHSRKSRPTLSAFADLKDVSYLNKKKSLANKLCHLSQQNKTSVTTTETASGADISLTEGCIENSSSSELPDLMEGEQETISDDWLPHYDSSVGKTVYVNKVTGLSRYEELASEQTEIRCTSDVTNMAVSVISEAGMEYICYPFQMDLVLPFLPNSRTERVCWSGLDARGISVTGADSDENSNSLFSLYSKWNNPVFVKPSKVCVDITCGQADGLAVKVHNILFPYRFSKAMIPSMTVVNQVDRKFLACLIDTREDRSDSQSESEGNLLVLVDQHAAHERVRLENVIADAYEDDPDAPGEKRLCSSIISPPLEITVPQEEQRLLGSYRAHLLSLGLDLTFSEAVESRVYVGKVPLCFTEKDFNERRRGRPSIIKPLVEEYLREQVELLRSAGRLRGTLPLTVQKVLASFACRGAIKFNDSLNRDECSSLVASLSTCQLPFQCAHGRPSIAPLVDLLHLDKEEKEPPRPNLSKLRRMYKAWQLFGKG